MIKSFFLLLFYCLLSANTCLASENATLKIYVEFENSHSEAVLEDFESILSDNGIQIKWTELSSSSLMFICQEHVPAYSFYIDSSKEKIIFKYSDEIGFQNAIYYLLQKWGFYFLGYSNNWMETPLELTPFVEKGIKVPDIPKLYYFGTGGYGKYSLQSQLIHQYQRRNLLNNYTGVGHGYSDFYRLNKQRIELLESQNLQIFRDNSKKNFNEDSPEVLALIIEYFENKYLSGEKKLIISPPDSTKGQGGNSNNPLVTNTITKYLWIGNEVAKYLNKKYPDNDITFGYYAYGDGKGQLVPPNFELEENIVIEIIPYAFQKDYLSDLKSAGDIKAFAAWKKYDPDKSYYTYDYWNISQWSQMLPSTDMFSYVKTKPDIWKKYGIKGATIESTYNSVITNPHFWVLSQYSRNFEKRTIDQLYEEYFDMAFKNASKEMYSFYEILSNWNGQFSMYPSLKILKEAYEKANNITVRNRVVEVMAYMHHVSLNYEALNVRNKYNNKESNFEEWRNKALEYERWAKKMNSLGVIQTWAAYYYDYGGNKPWSTGGSPDGYSEYLEKKNFGYQKSEVVKAINHDLTIWSHNKVVLSENEKTYNIEDFTLVKEQPYCIKPYITFEKSFFIPNNRTFLDIEIENPVENAVFEIKGSDGYYNRYENQNEDFTINDLVKPGVKYELWLGDRYYSSGVCFNNKNLLILHEGFTTSQTNSYGRNTFYIYIPENVEEVVFSGFEEAPKNYYTDILLEGKVLPKYKTDLLDKKSQPIYKVPTNTKNYNIKGKVIQIRSWVTGIEIHNFDPIISRQNFTKKNEN